MPAKPARAITCDVCAAIECRGSYPRGIPDYCLAKREREVLEKTKAEYAKPANRKIYLASSRVVKRGYSTYPRIQEAIEFCRELGVKKVGIASCLGLLREMALISELFAGAGFKVIGSNCQVGKVPPEERLEDLKGKDTFGLHCNPIAQAEILNAGHTEINFIVGLCLGHDILFTRYSKSPVSTLIVKDRVLGHNPAAALYTAPHRISLWKTYTGKDKF